MQAKYRSGAWMGVILLSLGMPLAMAEPQQDTEAAENAYKQGDVVSAMALWRKAAAQGYAPAQVRLGNILDVAEDDVEAVEWYQKAANQGDAAGEYSLGVMYRKGEGVKKDEEKVRSLILQAANKNYVPAMRLMVEFYKAGEAGLPLDLEQAGIWEDKMYAVMGISKPVPQPIPDSKKKRQ